jgi:AraC family transcriptional regulator
VQGDVEALFAEGLALSLAAYRTRHYAVAAPAGRPSDDLSRSKLRQASQFMDAHLAEPFHLKRLAQAVSMSEFHFSRLFKRATGPHSLWVSWEEPAKNAQQN